MKGIVYSAMGAAIALAVAVTDVGAMTVRGQWVVRDQQGIRRPLANVLVILKDSDGGFGGSDDTLATGITDADGVVVFQNVSNDDCFLCGTADPYMQLVLRNDALGLRVLRQDGSEYKVNSAIRQDAPDGFIDLGTWRPSSGTFEEAAAWIWMDIQQASQTVRDALLGPGDVTAFYPSSDNLTISKFNPNTGKTAIGVPIRTVRHSDMTIHEFAHCFLQNMGISQGMAGQLAPHSFYAETPPEVAFREGFATFFGFAVLSRFGRLPNGPIVDIPEIPDYQGLNFETFAPAGSRFPKDVPFGENSEGRIVGALWDLLDSSPDAMDTGAGVPLETILQTVAQHRILRFTDFVPKLMGFHLGEAQRPAAMFALLNNGMRGEGEDLDSMPGGNKFETRTGDNFFSDFRYVQNSFDVLGGDGFDRYYRLIVRAGARIQEITTCVPGTDYDSLVQVFQAGVGPLPPQFYFNDDLSWPSQPCSDLRPPLTMGLGPGVYYFVVDGFNGAQGHFGFQTTYDVGE
jgi:hypothetical protein